MKTEQIEPPCGSGWTLGGFPVAVMPAGSETSYHIPKHLIQSKKNLWHLLCSKHLVLWEMPKRDCKKIVNSPNLSNGSSKLLYEECILTIFPTS